VAFVPTGSGAKGMMPGSVKDYPMAGISKESVLHVGGRNDAFIEKKTAEELVYNSG
jgi:hypothetical protein